MCVRCIILFQWLLIKGIIWYNILCNTHINQVLELRMNNLKLNSYLYRISELFESIFGMPKLTWTFQTDGRKEMFMWVNFGSQGRLALISRGDEMRDTLHSDSAGRLRPPPPSLTTHLGVSVSTPGHCVYIPSLHGGAVRTDVGTRYLLLLPVVSHCCDKTVTFVLYEYCTLFALGYCEIVDRNVNEW